MENKKYYTPEIEDVNIGYECEVFTYGLQMVNGIFLPDEERDDEVKWRHRKIKSVSDLLHLSISLDKNIVRVPFLTREQIEKEGWEIKEGYLSSPPHNCVFTKGNMMGAILVDDRLVLVLKDITEDRYTEYMSQGQIFLGKCPSINEFRKIIKLLEINGK